MVTVRSVVLPVYPEENRPLRSAVSNAATSHKNSYAHTPTVNAGSSLAVADTILQFLLTLRPYPELGSRSQSKAVEVEPDGQHRSLVRGSDGQSDFGSPQPAEIIETHEPPGQEDLETKSFSTSRADRSSKGHTSNAASSLLLELMKGAASATGADTEPTTNRQNSENIQEPAWKPTSGSFAESFVMSQTSIARMFGLTMDEKSLQEKTAGSAQNDNRASARYRQQSPDSWGSVANSNGWGSVASSEGTTGSRRPQILRATFTEAGTYQFG